jgi:hypothetical protein
MPDISKIKLYYKDIAGAGKEIHAQFNQEFKCVEFTMRDDVPQPITWTFSDDNPAKYFFGERWIQFQPKQWSELIEAVFKEMVRLWNLRHVPQNLWREDPVHNHGRWVIEVQACDTLLGYWDWVAQQKDNT